MSDLVLDRPVPPLLEATEIHLAAGPGAALGPLSFGLEEASIAALAGIAGAGQAALLDIVCGERAADGGELRFKGERLDRSPPAARLRRGIVAMRQERLVTRGTLTDMLVTERVLLTRPWWRATFGIATGIGAADRKEIAELLDFLDIGRLDRRPVHSLGGLDAKLAELARCLVLRPRLLLLEHPLAGLGPEDRSTVARLLARLRDGGLTLLVVDDDLATLAELADRCLVLHEGQLIANASPRAIGGAPHVFRALTGSDL